jgi:nicotinate-nucleotide pyrophosphorylase (carboxylating)
MNKQYLQEFLKFAIAEDIGEGDFTTLSTILPTQHGEAKLLVKEAAIIAGVNAACELFNYIDNTIEIEVLIKDGQTVKYGDIVFNAKGKTQSLLSAERLILNVMQRMSGIATLTNIYVKKLEGLKTKVIDTRKTTPGFRMFEKEAVLIGGGANHRFGLYDMVLIKDNHIDYCGGITKAVTRASDFLKKNNKTLKIEVETRSIADVIEALSLQSIDRIMLDNFTVADTQKAVEIIDGKKEVESSGGITLDTIRDYALCGVDFISVGALTHQYKSVDLSLKAR